MFPNLLGVLEKYFLIQTKISKYKIIMKPKVWLDT